MSQTIPTFDVTRFREESIMFAVTFWQWVLELAANFVIYVYPQIPRKVNNLAEHVYTIAVQLFFAILNTFYLLGDGQFHMNASKFGIATAIFKALFQSN